MASDVVTRNRHKIEEIEIIRFFCILSVVGAHFSGRVFSTFQGISIFPFYCFRAYGTVGVVVFFIISGFLYNYKGKSLSEIIFKKVKYILIPTYISAFINYTVMHMRDFSLKEFLAYCYGGGSLYYYITVLMFCYIIFYYIKNNMILLYFMICINIVSILLFASDFIIYDQLPYPYVSSYLIPTNWIGFFALGILFKEKNLWRKITKYSEKYWIALLCIFIIATILYVYYCADIEISYFVYQSIPYELLGFFVLVGISRKLICCRILMSIGSSSFFIYLYHINIIGFVSNRLCFNWYIVILYPLIILIVLWICSNIIRKVSLKTNSSKWVFLLGIKES